MATKPRQQSSFENVSEVKDQHPRKERRAYPPEVVRKMMVSETKATPFSAKHRCTRCRDWFLTKFIVEIEQQWPKPYTTVCRICYDKKRDRKYSDAYKYKRTRPKPGC